MYLMNLAHVGWCEGMQTGLVSLGLFNVFTVMYLFLFLFLHHVMSFKILILCSYESEFVSLTKTRSKCELCHWWEKKPCLPDLTEM